MADISGIVTHPSWVFESPPDNYQTIGNFNTELEAEDHFCSSPAVRRWFTVKRQFRSRPMLVHPAKSEPKANYRYDVLLIPNGDLIAAGWKSGVVAIECKRSGEKLGPAFSQCLDYVYSCSSSIVEFGGVMVVPSYAFLYPSKTGGGPIESIQTQNRIGCAFDSLNIGGFEFWSGQTLICRFNSEWFEAVEVKAGNKTGSR